MPPSWPLKHPKNLTRKTGIIYEIWYKIWFYIDNSLQRGSKKIIPIHISWRYSQRPCCCFSEFCFTPDRIESIRIHQVILNFLDFFGVEHFFRIAYLIQNQLSSLIRMEGSVGEEKLNELVSMFPEALRNSWTFREIYQNYPFPANLADQVNNYCSWTDKCNQRYEPLSLLFKRNLYYFWLWKYLPYSLRS